MARRRACSTIPNRKLEPGEEKLYFNPFPLVPQRVTVARVTAHLEFSTPAEDAPPRVLDLTANISSRLAPVVAMPLSGRIFVWDGHDALGHHRRWDYSLPMVNELGFASNGMRYSYDFVLVDEANESSKPNATNNEDWFGFGIPVRAVEAGVVAKVVSKHPDDRSFDPRDSLTDINALLGNYVVIQQWCVQRVCPSQAGQRPRARRRQGASRASHRRARQLRQLKLSAPTFSS